MEVMSDDKKRVKGDKWVTGQADDILSVSQPNAVYLPANSKETNKCNREVCVEKTAKSDTVPVAKKDQKLIAELRTQIPQINAYFDIVKRIGEGTFSTVFLVTEKVQPNNRYAVKHLVPTSHPKRIARELKCLISIGGKDNVAGVHFCLRNENSFAFVMPYIAHDRFQDYFHLLNAKEVQSYMYNLLISLIRVHSFGVIHRDIKPTNFLHDRKNGKYMLVDFGLAQFMLDSELKSTNTKTTTTTTTASSEVKPTVAEDVSNSVVNDVDDQSNIGQNKRKAFELNETDKLHLNRATPVPCSPDHKAEPMKRPRKNRSNTKLINRSNDENRVSGGATVVSNTNQTNIPSPYKEPLRQHNDNFREIHADIQAPLVRHIKSAVLGYSINTKMQNQRRNQDKITRQILPPTVQMPSSSVRPINGKTSSSLEPISKERPNCHCYGKPTVCNICIVKNEVIAPRAGTPGYRPPEVLLKYPDQTTAVDMWAAGVILITILSGCYPFFKGTDDLSTLAEIVTVFGDDMVKKTALTFGTLASISQRKHPLHLRKLCIRLRNRFKTARCMENDRAAQQLQINQTRNGTMINICENCEQIVTECLCAHSFSNTDFSQDIFPDSLYDLLGKLLAINPRNRITAKDALQHEFFQENLQVPKENAI